MAVPVLFYRGPKSSYDVSQHGNGIYFCTDTYEIFMNNHSYGGGITSLTSPNETLTISGSGTSRSLVVNVAKIVSANSAIQVGTDGKLDIFWNEIS